MKTTAIAMLVCGLAGTAAAVDGIVERGPDRGAPERIVSRDVVMRNIVVRDVTARDGEVSGIVANQSSYPVRDVRLAIRYDWLWDNEMRPGTDDPSRAEFYTIPAEIPPGGSVRFTYRPSGFLPERRGGRFMTSVQPLEFVALVPSTAGSATSGVGGGSPPIYRDPGAAPGSAYEQRPPSGGTYEVRPPSGGTYEVVPPPAAPAPSAPPPRTPDVPY